MTKPNPSPFMRGLCGSYISLSGEKTKPRMGCACLPRALGKVAVFTLIASTFCRSVGAVPSADGMNSAAVAEPGTRTESHIAELEARLGQLPAPEVPRPHSLYEVST